MPASLNSAGSFSSTLFQDSSSFAATRDTTAVPPMETKPEPAATSMGPMDGDDCTEEGKKVRHPTMCHAYLLCIHKKYQVGECGAGLHWNDVSNCKNNFCWGCLFHGGTMVGRRQHKRCIVILKSSLRWLASSWRWLYKSHDGHSLASYLGHPIFI